MSTNHPLRQIYHKLDSQIHSYYSEMDSITLDPKIKTHVLLPITVIMILTHILRQQLNKLLAPKPKLAKMEKVREQQHLQKCTFTGQNSWLSMCNSEWEAKRNFTVDMYSKKANLNKVLEKPLVDEKEKVNDENAGISNPFTQSGMNEMIMSGLKGNLVNFLPQPILMFYMSFLFRGYIALKLPFTLTSNFKPMFQSSIMTPDLDVSYVTGISWYFVNLLGVESLTNFLYSCIFGASSVISDPENDVVENIALILSSGGNQAVKMPEQSFGFGSPKPDAVFAKAADFIRIANFQSCLTNIEQRFVEKRLNRS